MKNFIPCLLFLLPVLLKAQTPVLSFIPSISSGLSSPLDIVNAGDGSNRLFIVEQGGRIKYARGTILIDTVFLDISKIIAAGGERGLLSLAFHPQFKTNGYLFVYYTDLGGNITISRYQISNDPNKADSLTGRVLLTIPHTEFSNHNGGKLNFGSDGNLYFATGDGGSGGDPHFNAQNGNSLLGKMIRINVDNFATAPYYNIPAGNPYLAQGDNIRDEIWAFGLRNPFRWSFDRLTHDMWIGDVGQSAREEINFRPSANTGAVNYGWRCYEGSRNYNDSGCLTAGNYLSPIFDYDRSSATGGSTVTGGIVYRGTDYPALYGWYVCIDFFSTNGWLIQPNGSGGWNIQRQSGLPVNIAGFGEDENGELFAVALNGIIYRVQGSINTPLPLKLQSLSVKVENGIHAINWETSSEQNLRQFEIELSNNGTGFYTLVTVNATNTNTKKNYEFNYHLPNNEKVYYRLKIVDNNGKFEYSKIIEIESSGPDVYIVPTLIRGKTVNIQLNKPFRILHVVDMNGRILRTKNLNQSIGIINLDLTGLPKGMYTIKIVGNNREVYRKIMIQ